MIKYIVFIAIVIIVFFGWNFLQGKPSAPQHQYQQSQNIHQEESGGYGTKGSFYSKDGISLQHYWPGDGSFSNEETEILLFNDSNSNLEVKYFYLAYFVEGKTYPQKSGTWEKFPSKQSWDRIEYINISPQYYKGEPLSLIPGQKGKLHWHIQFGNTPLNGKQTVQVKITLIKGSETINIHERLERDSGTVFSSNEH